MSTNVRVALQPYSYNGSLPAKYDRGALSTELQKIQRGIAVPSIRTLSSAETASILDETILCDASGGALTVTLPNVATCVGLTLTVKKIDASANAVTIGGVVDGTTNPTLAAQWNSMTMQSNGTQWYLLANV